MAFLKDQIKSFVGKKKQEQITIEAKKEAKQAADQSTHASIAQPIQPVQAVDFKSQQAPLAPQNRTATQAATVTGSLQIALQNQSNSSQVYAYITGLAIDNNNVPCIIQADAKTPYYPANPSQNGASIPVNVSIPLGAPGSTVIATIPRLAGGRIWFSTGSQLTFLVNPGPALVEPSIFNPSDPNSNINFGFCEFTFNSAQVFANITYVDFVSAIPVALTIQSTNGATQHVSGLPTNGFATICSGLRAQTAKDGRRWSSLIVQKNGQDLRALSPNSGITLNPSWFQTYWNDYVNAVFSEFTDKKLTVQTQASFGAVTGQVNSSAILDFGNGCTFKKPTAADIFGNDTGPFATGSNSETNCIIPRLAAAFNRSTLLLATSTPDGTQPSQYYQNATTNHYARIVHAANVDGLGYTFPYDDVTPDGGIGQEGAVYSFQPTLLTVTVGGKNAYKQ